MSQLVTAALLHRLVVASHAEGTIHLAVATIIQDRERILLCSTGHGWDVPADLVLPGESLDDAAHRTAAAVGLHLDRLTAYLGHHDLHTDGDVVRTFVFAATLRVPPSTTNDCRWVPADDLPADLDPDILRFIHLTGHAGSIHTPARNHRLAAALRAPARGLPAAEAAVELLIDHGFWLQRHDFVDHYVHTVTDLDNPHPTSCVNWPASIRALEAGQLPCSSTEAQMLRISASLAEGVPIDLRDALTGLDTTNLELVVQAMRHTSGHHHSSPRR